MDRTLRLRFLFWRYMWRMRRRMRREVQEKLFS